MPDAPRPPDPAQTLVPLTEPADGVPEVVTEAGHLAEVVAAFAAGTGPVAVDAERASGYRYGQHNYLVQLRRAGVGTALIDPVALPDLSAMNEALAGAEWVFHAASQDLPGLAEQRLVPDRIFDTELAARLLGLPRVGLAAVVGEVLGLSLAKEHSAVDWSTRPLPADWLRYAALDVEVLVELRHGLADRLEAAGKSQWAAQEFEAVRLAPPAAPRTEPWRRLSGLHTLRDRRQYAVAREMWLAREAEARARDLSPGRVLRDAAIVAAAAALPEDPAALGRVKEFTGRSTRKRLAHWHRPVARALALPASALPTTRGPGGDGPPPPRSWADRDPAAAARLAAAREVTTALSEHHRIPVENLLQPDLLRRLCWSPPEPTEEAVAERLVAGGARPWQVSLLAAALADAFGAIG